MTTFLSTYLLNDSRLATTTLGAQAESALLSTFPFFLAQRASAQDALADRVLEHVGFKPQQDLFFCSLSHQCMQFT